MRFFLEGYLEFAMMASINIKCLYWHEGLPAVSTSNVVAMVFFALAIVLPLFFMYHYVRNVQNWNNE